MIQSVKSVFSLFKMKVFVMCLAVASVFAPVLSFAEDVSASGPDLSTLTSQVHFDSVVAAMLSVFGAGVVMMLAWVGGSKIFQALKKIA
ncbi:hypothetical protein FXQ12_24480 [Salmonella enterica]|nr:hypothetical protein [Salmonella enterica]ECC9415160.1 hypothetical protein [Salmonella enterica subsp. enterica]EHF1448725.1 hypothetical protein [Salmonella enterica subsp. enterica serovar 4,5,12:b:-]EHG1528837.1 hypothetical protein [Salmonella enterica subsp. enterica serovar 4,[5],12:b:-]ECD8848871.1 hypothetical protein [Salmonella enterica subsp. enterica]